MKELLLDMIGTTAAEYGINAHDLFEAEAYGDDIKYASPNYKRVVTEQIVQLSADFKAGQWKGSITGDTELQLDKSQRTQVLVVTLDFLSTFFVESRRRLFKQKRSELIELLRSTPQPYSDQFNSIMSLILLFSVEGNDTRYYFELATHLADLAIEIVDKNQ